MNALTQDGKSDLVPMATLEKVKAALTAPSKRGDIISCGVFDGSNGQCVCWADYVSDPLLYEISKGAKGWATARTEPTRFSDKMKQRKMAGLQDYIFAKVTCGLSVSGGGN